MKCNILYYIKAVQLYFLLYTSNVLILILIYQVLQNSIELRYQITFWENLLEILNKFGYLK